MSSSSGGTKSDATTTESKRENNVNANNSVQSEFTAEQLFETDVKIISDAFKSLCTRIGGFIQIALAIWLLVLPRC